MTWILLGINLIYGVLKIIFLIRDNTKGLPKVRRVFYKNKVRTLSKRYKDDPVQLKVELNKLAKESKGEQALYRAN